MHLTQINSKLIDCQHQYQFTQHDFDAQLQLIPANYDKNVEIISNLGGKEPSPRFQARRSIEGLTDLALGFERLQFLWLLLTHARTDTARA